MEKPERRSSRSPQAQAPQQSECALDEARALFEQMAGEVTHRSEFEREEARRRGPVGRVLLVLTITVCLLAAATGLYGVYNFPDAPIRQTAGGYVGKGGKPRAQEDFEAFILWEKVMLIVFPSAFLIGLAFGITDARQRRLRKS
jgi:hypothetical protein